MRLLNVIFSNVVFSEIDSLFDEMEKAFLLLVEGYELNMPEEATDNGIYQRMEELLNRWDENLPSRSRDLDVYFECRVIYTDKLSHLISTVVKNNRGSCWLD